MMIESSLIQYNVTKSNYFATDVVDNNNGRTDFERVLSTSTCGEETITSTTLILSFHSRKIVCLFSIKN